MDEDEAKRIVLTELLKELGLPLSDIQADLDASSEQYEDDQVRDTYAYYGLAMYFAQVFEHEVVNMLVLARIVQSRENAERILTDPWERHFRLTLGQLFRELKPFLGEDQQLSDDVAHGVQVRNQLAHSYWRVHAEDAVSIAGRAEMITELIGIREMFIDLDERLTNVGQPFRESLGITQERLLREYDEMKKRVAERDKKEPEDQS